MNVMEAIKTSFSGLVARLGGGTLKARCARSSVILGVGVFSAKVLGFASKVILARLLVPQEMGLMVMILSLTALFDVLTEIGVKQSVIQHENGADLEYLNMAWWFQSLRAVGLYMIAFILAPWLCEFYFRSKPEVLTRYSMVEITNLVRVAFLTIFFNGFVSPKAYVLEKMFRFGKAVLITQGSFFLGYVVIIVLAFMIRNVWAIVIGFASTGLIKCALSHAICPFRPKFAYHRESFQGLYRFARGMFGLPILAYIAFNIDVLVAGKMVSTYLVGLYGMALTLAISPWDFFTGIISPVLLPAFSEKQGDKAALCKGALKITKYMGLLVISPMALAMICGSTILTIYGEEYSAIAVPFGLLCVYVVLLIQGTIFTSLFFGIGQPSKNRAFAVVRCLVLILLIYPGIRFFGLTGAAAVILLASFIAISMQLVVIRKAIGLNIFDYVISWLPGIIMAIPVLIIVVVVRVLNPQYPIAHLAVGAMSCIVICLSGLFLLRHFERQSRHLPGSAVSAGFAGKEDTQRA